MEIILSRLFPDPIVEKIITYSYDDEDYIDKNKTINDIKLKFMCYKKYSFNYSRLYFEIHDDIVNTKAFKTFLKCNACSPFWKKDDGTRVLQFEAWDNRTGLIKDNYYECKVRLISCYDHRLCVSSKIKFVATLKNHKQIEKENDKLNLRYISTKKG